MVYYPLSINAKKRLLTITTPEDQESFKITWRWFAMGCKLDYSVQEKPEGIAQSLIAINGLRNLVLILGDNLFLVRSIFKNRKSYK